MTEDQPSDMAMPADPAVERCKENARRLQLLRERLAAERSEDGPDDRVSDRVVAAEGVAPA